VGRSTHDDTSGRLSGVVVDLSETRYTRPDDVSPGFMAEAGRCWRIEGWTGLWQFGRRQ
jgi:hypothetical protein